MKRAAAKWESEAAMLTAFAAVAREMGFRVVPEACGHDLLLVAGPQLLPVPGLHRSDPPDRIEPGDVIAVEGKLRPSLEVLYQSLPPDRLLGWAWQCHHPTGVGGVERCGTCMACRHMAERARGEACDFYAVVVPEAPQEFRTLAEALGVCVITMHPAEPRHDWTPASPARIGMFDFAEAHRVVGHPRPAVPTLDVEITPGLPAPRKLTPWKIGAVRLCLLAQRRDLTLADFAMTPVTPRSLVDRGWLERIGRGASARFALLDSPTRPDLAYPEIAAAIEAQEPVVVEAPRVPGALFAAGGGA